MFNNAFSLTKIPNVASRIQNPHIQASKWFIDVDNFGLDLKLEIKGFKCPKLYYHIGTIYKNIEFNII